EEAVGAMARRRQTQPLVASARKPGRRRNGAEPGMLLEKSVDAILVLAPEHRTGGIQQPPARLHETRRAGEDRPLQGGQFVEIGAETVPARVRVAAPRADAAAGRVDQNPVEHALVALDPGVALGLERATLHIVGASAAEADAGAVQPAAGDVACDHAALVRHGRGDRQRLAAGTGAEVDSLHAGASV